MAHFNHLAQFAFRLFAHLADLTLGLRRLHQQLADVFALQDDEEAGGDHVARGDDALLLHVVEGLGAGDFEDAEELAVAQQREGVGAGRRAAGGAGADQR